MFCGNCGAQVPDGAAVCPKCGKQLAAKSKAPQMNQASQNAGARANGAAGGSGKKFDVKKVGIIAGAVVAVIALVLVLKGIFGGGGLDDGVFVNSDGQILIIDGNKMTFSVACTTGYSVKYKVEDNTIEFDLKSVKFSKDTLEYFEDELDYNKDDIEEELEDIKETLESASKWDVEYDEKKKTLTLHNDLYYYAKNYEVGPSGEYIYDNDEDISITFKDGKATFNNDGEEETLTYYCYKMANKEVVIRFYGEDLCDSDFYDEYGISSADYHGGHVWVGGHIFKD